MEQMDQFQISMQALGATVYSGSVELATVFSMRF